MKPVPDLQDAQYGPHERNVLDLWMATSNTPTPLVLYFHGGGFFAGDKENLDFDRLSMYLNAGVSVAAINYRLTIANKAPAPAAYLDGARALQFLRYNARNEIDTPRAYKLYEEATPITYVSRNAPPAWLSYNLPNEDVDEDTPLGLIVHHPKYGIALKERLDELGVECVVQYLDGPGGKIVRHYGQLEGNPVSEFEFVCSHFERKKKATP